MTESAGNKLTTLVKNIRLKAKATDKSWLFLSYLFVFLILFPILFLFSGLFSESGSSWNHITRNLLPDYVLNTIILVSGISLTSLVFAILPAWIFSNYKFYGSGILKWMMILPLAVPTYIVSFIYVDIFSYGGEFFRIVEFFTGFSEKDFYFDIISIYALIPILSSVLYPYIYITTLTAFEKRNSNFIDAAKTLGASQLKIFFKIALPLARPAIFGGLFLLIMEVLNDYGAMKYFGIQTFTTGIFRAWFSMNDLNSAIKLSLILFSIVALILIIERYSRRKMKYSESGTFRPVIKKKVNGLKGIILLTLVSIPLILGFIIPMVKLLYNMIISNSSLLTEDVFLAFSNSFLIAISSALLMVILSIIINIGVRNSKFKSTRYFASAVTAGYSIPGAIIAVCMIMYLTFLDNIFLISSVGSVAILLYAYNIRFLAVSYSPVNSGLEKIGDEVQESSRMLGYSQLKTFFSIDYPLIRPAIFSAFMIAVVEIVKELPLTLILRPFNFETLATQAFRYANDEMLIQASVFSFLIVVIAAIPLLFLRKSYQTEYDK